MANFNTHLLVASTISGMTATALYGANIIGPQEVIQNFSLGAVAGLLPDIDSDNSVVLRLFFNLIAVAVSFFVMLWLSVNLSIAEMFIVWIACFVAIFYGGYSVFKHFTVHRGIFHSIPAALFFGIGTAALFFYFLPYTALVSWIAGAFVILGYLVHLTLDEIYSVDLANNKIKRSFGSALKVVDTKNLPSTIAMYVAVIAATLLAPNPQTLFDTVFTPEFIQALKMQFLPANGWFHFF